MELVPQAGITETNKTHPTPRSNLCIPDSTLVSNSAQPYICGTNFKRGGHPKPYSQDRKMIPSSHPRTDPTLLVKRVSWAVRVTRTKSLLSALESAPASLEVTVLLPTSWGYCEGPPAALAPQDGLLSFLPPSEVVLLTSWWDPQLSANRESSCWCHVLGQNQCKPGAEGWATDTQDNRSSSCECHKRRESPRCPQPGQGGGWIYKPVQLSWGQQNSVPRDCDAACPSSQKFF